MQISNLLLGNLSKIIETSQLLVFQVTLTRFKLQNSLQNSYKQGFLFNSWVKIRHFLDTFRRKSNVFRIQVPRHPTLMVVKTNTLLIQLIASFTTSHCLRSKFQEIPTIMLCCMLCVPSVTFSIKQIGRLFKWQQTECVNGVAVAHLIRMSKFLWKPNCGTTITWLTCVRSLIVIKRVERPC